MTSSKVIEPATLSTFSLLWLRLRTHPILLFALLAFIAGTVWVGQWTYHRLLTDQHQQAVEHTSNASAKSQAIRVNDFLSQQQQQLKTMAASDALISGFQQEDVLALTKLEDHLRKQHSDLQSLHLLLPNDSQLDRSRNFVARELALNAFSGAQPTPEAVWLEGGWQLLFVQPVVAGNKSVVGALVAGISTDVLHKKLLPESAIGRTDLHQQLPDLPGQSFITTGHKLDGLFTATKKTQLPYWQIRFTGNQQLLNNTAPPVKWVLIILTGLTLAALLLLFFALRAILNRYKAELIPQLEKTKKQEKITQKLLETSSFLQAPPSAKDATKDEPASKQSNPIEDKPLSLKYPVTIFRDYDIRGIYKEQIDASFANQLGLCIGSLALQQGETALVLGWDGRLSSPELREALQNGILATGCDVISIGQAPTPLLGFAIHELSETSSGVMVTASHNPAQDNGFKIFIKNHALCGDEIHALRDAMIKGDFQQGSGHLEELDIDDKYASAIIGDIVPALGLKVVVDAGNGVAGKYAIEVLSGVGCEVIPLYCDVDGNFPNHPPDTAVAENLTDLRSAVTAMEADLGIGLDGDGDRIVAVTAKGQIVWPDELLMIFARDVVSRHPGSDIVFDIKSTRRLNALISSYGGRPVMWKTGHSHMRNKILECNAPLGGEFSGHLFFNDRWHGFDDGIYAAARLVEIMAVREQSLEDILSVFETCHSTPEIKVLIADEKKFGIIESLIAKNAFSNAQVTTLDGLRVDFPKAWGLIRASNTSPALTLRFEADSAEGLEKIQSLFRQQLSSIDSSLTF